MKLLAIARNAFIEATRQPVYGVLILITFAVLVMDLPLSTYTMGTGIADYMETDQQMMINLGLSTLLISGLLISAFSASGVLSREIEDKTILTVVSKPVPRPMVVLGKFMGVSAAILVAYWLCSLVFLMTVRHKVMPTASDPYDFPVIILGCSAFILAIIAGLFCNYFFGWNFASSSVGFGVILLTLAMGTITFVGKGWTIVPPGYDVPPQSKPGFIKVEFQPGYSADLFVKNVEKGPYEVDEIARDRTNATVRVPGIVQLAESTRDIKMQEAFDRVEEMMRDAAGNIGKLDGVKSTAPVFKQESTITGQLLLAMFLLLFAVLVFAAVAVAASTRLGQVMTLLICFAFFFLGSLSPYFFGRFAAESPAAKAAYLLCPNLTFFYIMDALMSGRSVPSDYFVMTIAYSACQIIAIVAIGMLLFQRRELTAQEGAGSSSAPLPVSVIAWLGRGGAIAAVMIALTVPNKLGMVNGFVSAIILCVAAVAGWVLFGWFGRGVKWTWYFAVICAVITVVLAVAAGLRSISNISTQLVLIPAAAAAVVLILLLPGTRHHFNIVRKNKRVHRIA